MANTAPLDKNAQILTQAIALQEGGGKVNYGAVGDSGASAGAYQWNNGPVPLRTGQVPANFASMATKYGLDPTDFSPANQNQVAYSHVKSLLDSGMSPAQVASSWNAGAGEKNAYTGQFSDGSASTTTRFNVPGYVSGVQSYASKLYQAQANQQPTIPSPDTTAQPAPDASGAWFPASPNDSPITAGLKALGNLPQSAFNFGKGIVSSLNPINTLQTLGNVASGLINRPEGPGQIDAAHPTAAPEGVGQLLLDTVTGLPAAAYHSLVPASVQKLFTGDLSGAAAQLTNDPFGQVAPIALAALGGADVLDKQAGGFEAAAKASRDAFTETGVHVMPQEGVYSSALNRAIQGTAAIGKPFASLLKPPLSLAGGFVSSAASHLLGLDPADITNIIQNPDSFSKIARDQVSRGGLANEFGTAIDGLQSHLQDTGAGYNGIRADTSNVPMPENLIPNVLNRFGLSLDDQGKVIADSNSITRNTSDINAIQKFVNDWKDKPTLTPNEILNMRSDATDLANYDKLTGMGKTAKSQVIGEAFRQSINDNIRPNVKGLKNLDQTYSPAITQMKQIKKDFLQKGPDGDYVFKDNAINKIANATGPGKDALLNRMEEVMPGITKKIQILKTTEAIEAAYKNKVGNYTRSIIEGGAVLTGNVPTVIAAILTNPAVAVPILRGLGWGWEKVAPVVEALKIIGGDVNAMRSPTYQSAQKNAVESPYVRIGNGVGLRLTVDEAQKLQRDNVLKLPAPAVRFGGAPVEPQTITVKAGKIVNELGDVVGYSSTGHDIKVKGTDSPYTKNDDLPIIKFGTRPKAKKDGLPVIKF